MRLPKIDRTVTKKSCIGNALVAFILALVMIGCIFVMEDVTAEQIKAFLVSAGIMAVVGSYWLYRCYKFEDEDFNDPFHFNH